MLGWIVFLNFISLFLAYTDTLDPVDWRFFLLSWWNEIYVKPKRINQMSSGIHIHVCCVSFTLLATRKNGNFLTRPFLLYRPGFFLLFFRSHSFTIFFSFLHIALRHKEQPTEILSLQRVHCFVYIWICECVCFVREHICRFFLCTTHEDDDAFYRFVSHVYLESLKKLKCIANIKTQWIFEMVKRQEIDLAV